MKGFADEIALQRLEQTPRLSVPPGISLAPLCRDTNLRLVIRSGETDHDSLSSETCRLPPHLASPPRLRAGGRRRPHRVCSPRLLQANTWNPLGRPRAVLGQSPTSDSGVWLHRAQPSRYASRHLQTHAHMHTRAHACAHTHSLAAALHLRLCWGGSWGRRNCAGLGSTLSDVVVLAKCARDFTILPFFSMCVFLRVPAMQ